ncbi:MAG: PAS domain S-box protein [Sphaerochaetaceae bacterium]|nr:PAS domain S-box protein [Sphaerochaetaceae bacterium]
MDTEQLQREINSLRTQLHELSRTNETLSEELSERRKELAFHNGLTRLISSRTSTIDSLCRYIVEHLPDAFRYPQNVSVFLEMNERQYTSMNAELTGAAVSYELGDDTVNLGILRIYCRNCEEDKEGRGSAFLPEELALLSLLVQRVLHYALQHREEMELFSSWKRYLPLFDSLSEVLFEISLSGIFTYSSNALPHVLGFQPQEVQGTTIYDYLHPAVHESFSQVLSSLEKRSMTSISYRLRMKSGRYKWCKVSLMPIIEEGKVLGAQGIFTDIDTLMHVEESLKESESMLNTLFTHMEQGVIYHDSQGRVLDANPAALRLLGLTIDQLNDHSRIPCQWHLTDESDCRVFWIEFAPMRALRSGTRISDEVVGIYRGDGSKRSWVIVNSEPQFYENDQNPSLVFTTLTDITRQKEVELQLNAQVRYTNSIIESMPDGLLILNHDGFILQFKPSVLNRSYLPVQKYEKHYITDVFPAIPIGNYLNKGRDVLLNLAHAVEFFEMAIGGSPHYLEARFSALTEERLLVVVRDYTVQHQMEIALLESSRKVNLLLNNLKGVALRALADGQWTIDFMSDGIEELTGYPADDFIRNAKRSFLDLIPSEELDAVRSAIKTELAVSGRFSVEHHLMRRDGNSRWVWVNGRGVYESGTLSFIEGFITDVTERRQMEEELRRNEEKYRSLIESLDVSIMIIDEQGVYQYMNEVGAASFSLPPEEFIGKCVSDIFPAPYSRDILSAVHQVLQDNSGQDFTSEYTVDSQERWFKVSMQPIHDAEGKPAAVLLAATDVTKERQQVVEFTKLNTAIEQSPVSVVITDRNGTIEYVNPKTCETTGYTREELLGSNPRVLRSGNAAPEYYEDLWDSITSGEVWQGTFQNVKKDGDIYVESATIAPIKDDDGIITHFIAIKEDITEKQQLQKDITLNEERFRQVAEYSRTVIWEADREGVFTYISPVASMVYGFSPDAWIGAHSVFDLRTADSAGHFHTLYRTLIDRGEPVSNYDNSIVQQDGSTLWVSSSAEALYDENTNIIGARGVDYDIDQRKQIEIELRKFQTVSDQANYGNAVADLEGNLLYVNEYFAAMHGYRPEELIGKHLSIFHSEKQMPRIARSLDILREKGEFAALEIPHTRRDGSVFPSLMNGKLIMNDNRTDGYLIASAVDITELKEQEEAIRRLEIAIEQSPVALMITDLQGIITYVSPAFTAITDYTGREALGQKTVLLKSGMNDPIIYKDLWETITAGHIWEGSLINRKKSGELYHESMSITPIYDMEGQVTSYLAVKEDITDRMRIEEERIARIAAEEANRSKSLFLSNMSHEIRTPLNAIIGFSQILETDSALTMRQKEQIKTITRSGRHLLELINDVLDLSKIEAGKLMNQVEVFALSDFLEDLEAMFSLIAERKAITFTIERDPMVPAFLEVDGGKLRQILINILGNSFKFTEKGTITVRLAIETVDNHHELSVAVIDTGVGIRKEDLKHIFEAFKQSEAGMHTGGTGLGLAITKRLIEIMGGSISTDSTYGSGSTFTFSVPVIPSSSDMHYQMIRPGLNAVGFDLRDGTYRILIVDDQKDNLDLLSALLTPLGFTLFYAVNGQEAIDMCVQEEIDLILMDLRMPVMDGYTATRKIKALNQGVQIPIIAVTASAFEDDRKAVLAQGFDGYLKKPLTREELFAEIADILDLDLVYGGKNEQGSPVSKLSSEGSVALHAIPKEFRDTLYAFIENGDVISFKEKLGTVAAYSEEASVYLKSLADVYDYDTLLNILTEGEE